MWLLLILISKYILSTLENFSGTIFSVEANTNLSSIYRPTDPCYCHQPYRHVLHWHPQNSNNENKFSNLFFGVKNKLK